MIFIYRREFVKRPSAVSRMILSRLKKYYKKEK